MFDDSWTRSRVGGIDFVDIVPRAFVFLFALVVVVVVVVFVFFTFFVFLVVF
jgi:hypothetical protein